MKTFVRQHEASIHGVLCGFDRVRFRGTLRAISFADGFFKYLCVFRILLKALAAFLEGTSRKLRLATERLAKTTPVGKVVYLSGPCDKQQILDELIRKHGVADDFAGRIAVLSCVENCRSFEVHKNAATKKLGLRSDFRKCLHYYLCLRHPRFGRMHVRIMRIMTWFPMQVQICLNGREWLARQMDAAGIEYQRRDNCFAWVSDFARAQALLDEQVRTDWAQTLSELLREVHPEFERMRKNLQVRDYYWTAEQTDVATDVAFRSEKALAPLYRRLLRHAIESLSSVDAMRFLQQRLATKSGTVHRNFDGEAVSDLRVRKEGTRVKHRLGVNSVKMYDKFGVVLRVETTIREAEGLKVFRPKENDPQEKLAWLPMRRGIAASRHRGIADLHRRFELSRRSNAAYLEALSVVECPETLGELAAAVSAPVTRKGRRHRGLNVLSAEDGRLLAAIHRGEHAIAGFRNRDLRELLFGSAPDAIEAKRRSARITRRLQLLRAHRLIRKVPKSHRYTITVSGRKLASALSCARESSLIDLCQAA